jgi:hypothetical protein
MKTLPNRQKQTIEKALRMYEIIKRYLKAGAYPSLRVLLEEMQLPDSTSYANRLIQVLIELDLIERPEMSPTGMRIKGQVVLFPDEIELMPFPVREYLKKYHQT